MKYCIYIFVLLVSFSCKQEKETVFSSKKDNEKTEDSINPWSINGSHAVDLHGVLTEKEMDSFFNNNNHYKVNYKTKDTLVGLSFLQNEILDVEFNYPEISKRITSDSLIFQNDTLKIEFLKAKFIASKHIISHDANGYVSFIDGKEPYGIDGDLPKTCIKPIGFYLHEVFTKIYEEDFEDLFEPNFKSAKLYITDFNELIYTSWNSDGAGGYYLILFINLNGQTKRIISMP